MLKLFEGLDAVLCSNGFGLLLYSIALLIFGAFLGVVITLWQHPDR